MRTNKILKVFCLPAALLLVGLTARQAMALFPDSYFCTGTISGSTTSAIPNGPVTAAGFNEVTNVIRPCVVGDGAFTYNFSDGTSLTAGFTYLIGESPGCVSPTPNTANTCPSFTADAKHLCVIPTGEACPAAESGNCLGLDKFNSTGCPKVQVGSKKVQATCELASNIAGAGAGLVTFTTDPNTGKSTPFTGCDQFLQAIANPKLTDFTYSYTLPLGFDDTGTSGASSNKCDAKGTSINIQCVGTAQF